VTNLPQNTHVTIWTDWGFPVVSFNVFLTGYDTQSISLYDVVINGIIAPKNANLTAGGTSSNTAPGSVSSANGANPNLTIANCHDLPGIISSPLRTAITSALTTGVYNAAGFSLSCGTTTRVGSAAATHHTITSAVGYVTIDVTAACT